ncbi:MAG: MarR family transcriptional regulator, partial [Actinomycetota bacterium]
MPTVPTDPRHRERYELGLRIAFAWRTIRRGASWSALREYLYGTGNEAIEQGMMDTLDMLALQPSWRMSELADALRVDPSTATRAVQRLEKAGLAERRPSTADGRVVEVQISEA